MRARFRLPEPISTTIEYLSADGDFSRRSIRIESIIHHDDRPMTVEAFCYMRDAIRTFTCQRINAVITNDGEIMRPDALIVRLVDHINNHPEDWEPLERKSAPRRPVRRLSPTELGMGNGSMNGMKIVFTGQFASLTRKEAAEIVTQRGGIVKANVGRAIDVVVVGEKPGGKQRDAIELGIPVIRENDFIDLIKSADILAKRRSGHHAAASSSRGAWADANSSVDKVMPRLDAL